MSTRTLAYRRDIDGLRAVAVLAVTAFHLGFGALEGGFVGVDIFFVISGFLISSIIEIRHAKNAFSFKDFYLGRVRRLLPALLATVIATFIGAALLMTPDDLMQFAGSAIGSVLSVSNFVFFFEAGYWDTSSELKPLLHTWSLGVEEQFYIFWPLMLVGIFTFARRFAGVFFLLLTIASLALSQWMVEVNPSAAFYLLPFRVFEFSLGALIVYLARTSLWTSIAAVPGIRDGSLLMGLGLSVYSILIFGGDTPFPGITALVPCLGAALVILSGMGDVPRSARLLLSNSVSVWLGQVSYSMYLVHWPIVALYRYETGLHLDLAEQAVLAAAILAATLLLHYGVERRFRFTSQYADERRMLTPTAFALSVAVCGWALTLLNGHVLLNQGWTWRLPAIQLTPEQIEAGKRERFANLGQACRIDRIGASPNCEMDKPVQILFLGNSHEPDGFNFFLGAYRDRQDINMVHFGTLNRCSDLSRREEGWTTSTNTCKQRLANLFNPEIVRSFDVIVYAANKPFAINKAQMLEILLDLKAINPDVKLVTLGGLINTDVSCARLINETGSARGCLAPDHVTYFEDAPEAAPLYADFDALSYDIIDRVDLLCENRLLENCIVGTPDGVPMMYDEHHQSRAFAEYSGELFVKKYPAYLDDLLEETSGDSNNKTALPEQPYHFEAMIDLTEIIASPQVRTDIGQNRVLLTRREGSALQSGGQTNGARFAFKDRDEDWLAGKSIRVRVKGEADSANELLIAYSTNEIGNSGWKAHPVEGPFEVIFEYDVPGQRTGRGDYLGLAPATGSLTVNVVQFENADD